MIVTIDPGLATGWALWEVLGKLTACGLGDPRSCEQHVAMHVHDVWIESPFIYPHAKARPADILKLAREAGEWGGRYEVSAVATIHYVLPAEWKGQVPKEIHHARVWDALDAAERAIVDKAVRGLAPSKRHNVLDAVGMGVWVRSRTR